MSSQKITLNGTAYPCRVTMGALVRFKRASGKDVSAMSSGDLSELTLFLWCCVASASAADGVAFDLSFEDFADLLDPQSVTSFVTTLGGGEKKSATPA